MDFRHRNGVALAYEDTETSLPPLLLVHGCGLDHTSMRHQEAFFRTSHRVISVDLRGHGKSDAPHQDYTMAAFAEDLVWLCGELGIRKPVIVGHSMGGNVALEVAARYPEVPASVVMMDSVMFPSQRMLDSISTLLTKTMAGSQYLAGYREALSAMCLPTDELSRELIASLQVAEHVLVSALSNHTINYSPESAASACHVPVAYIFSAMPFLDLDRFHSLTPQLVEARTLGCGHLSPVEVPDQIHAMIFQFLYIQRDCMARQIPVV